MTYDSRAWTGRYPERHFPHFAAMFVTPWFGFRLGPMLRYDAYGLEVSWGRVPPAPFVATHKHYHRWVWWTAEQVMDRA